MASTGRGAPCQGGEDDPVGDRPQHFDGAHEDFLAHVRGRGGCGRGRGGSARGVALRQAAENKDDVDGAKAHTEACEREKTVVVLTEVGQRLPRFVVL